MLVTRSSFSTKLRNHFKMLLSFSMFGMSIVGAKQSCWLGLRSLKMKIGSKVKWKGVDSIASDWFTIKSTIWGATIGTTTIRVDPKVAPLLEAESFILLVRGGLEMGCAIWGHSLNLALRFEVISSSSSSSSLIIKRIGRVDSIKKFTWSSLIDSNDEPSSKEA